MRAGITVPRTRSRRRGGTAPVTFGRAAGVSGAADGAPLPPLPAGAGCFFPAATAGPALGALCASAMVLRLVDDLARLLGDAGLLAVRQQTDANPRGCIGPGIHQHHVGEVQGRLALDDTALAKPLSGALVLLHHVEALDEDTPLGRQHPQHLPSLAPP